MEYLSIILFVIILILICFFIVAWFFVSRKNRKLADFLINKEKEARSKMYEIAILKELGDKIGYSLNLQKILEMISGSLKQFLDYSVVSYIILDVEKIIFKNHIQEEVSNDFINQLKLKMLKSLSLVYGKDFSKLTVDISFSGLKINNDSKESLKSYFIIPISINNKVQALLAIASYKANSFKDEEMTMLYKIVQQATKAVSKLQDVVKQENSKMNAMVYSMTEGVAMTDNDYKIIVANPAIKSAINVSYDYSLSVADFVDKLSDKFNFIQKIKESIQEGKIFFSEEISLGQRFFKIIISPVKSDILLNNKEQILGSVIIFHDITLDKELEKAKEEFVSMIVHELRSPLDGIKKMTEFIRATKIKKQKQSECLQMIYHSSSDLLQLVNNLLDMSKIEAGKFDIVKQDFSIKELINSRISFYQVAATDAKVQVSSFFDNDLPEKISFDPRTISQVLNNLISNALKFNKEQGIIQIQAVLCKAGENIVSKAKSLNIKWFIKDNISINKDCILVAVSNTGQGIAPDQISKLFNKFSQIKTVFTKQAGTGLGLAITKSIIESHEGIVGVQSEKDQGATFYFTLPLENNNKDNIIINSK